MDCHTYLAHALIRHRLRVGREHALNKQYALNSGVRLITRVYGMWLDNYKVLTSITSTAWIHYL